MFQARSPKVGPHVNQTVLSGTSIPSPPNTAKQQQGNHQHQQQVQQEFLGQSSGVDSHFDSKFKPDLGTSLPQSAPPFLQTNK
ncbi:hypothetical protein E2C01_008554 [Portunus trituberculatus]|uniref:Uncharacterized protein n=1 Tax=Portunus trituberculatus TaxID=210409 RepID=A0A5B7D5I3_PORTR|nr:hypothetical protein [Portunus trituberculatus]